MATEDHPIPELEMKSRKSGGGQSQSDPLGSPRQSSQKEPDQMSINPKIKDNIKLLLSNPEKLNALAKSTFDAANEANTDQKTRHLTYPEVYKIFDSLGEKLGLHPRPSESELVEILKLVDASTEKQIQEQEWPLYLKILFQILLQYSL
jgi:hypothetical protein